MTTLEAVVSIAMPNRNSRVSDSPVDSQPDGEAYLWGAMGPDGALWGPMGPYEALWGPMGALWSPMVLYGAL